ncbi:MAG: DUF4388 domain-containing protein [Polyangiaceae bacterium]
MSVGRRGPLSFLDTEWRTALWKRWVATHLVNDGSAAVDTPSTNPTGAVSTPLGSAPEPAAATAHDSPVTSNDVLEAAQAVPRRAPPLEDRRNERRADVRARFDALSERLQGLEDAVDVIARRLSHRSRRERRTDRRTAELVESIAENVEAHALALENLGATLERIERRFERIERPGIREERESRAPKARHSEPPRSVSVHPPRLDDTGDFSLGREASDEDDPSISGSSIRGSIGDMSLSTVLAMLEIERRSGRLKVQGDDGALVAFELEDGSVVGSRVSESDVDAVESLREVLTWKNGRFWFRQNPSESQISPPRSVNSLLLEATRQIDEAIRVG